MKKYKLISFVTGFFMTLAFIVSAVKFTINFRLLYYFDINYLHITQDSGFPKSEIIKNYNVLIDYLHTFYKGPLIFPTFPMSVDARIHFEDVKNLLIHMDYLMYFSIIIAIIGIIYLLKNKEFRFLKYSAITTIVLPVLLATPMAINFDESFIVFHKIFFRNNYWLFNPVTDPIINCLPETYFMHCAVLILLIITAESVILYSLYRHAIFSYVKKHSTTSE